MNLPPSSLLAAKIFTGNVNYLLLLVIMVLLACSAFFSSAETCYSTANMLRMKSNAENKVKGSRRALWILDHYNKTLITILIGNNLVNIASTTICAIVLGQMFVSPTLANIMNTVVMTIIVLIFGEILPKCLAKINPDKLAMRYSAVMWILIKVLTPISFFFSLLQNSLTRHIKQDSNPTVTENELESIIDTMEEEGVIDGEDAELFQGVLDIKDTTAYDIMTPRVDMVGVDSRADIETIKKTFLEYQYSRMPVYEGDKDHVIGILNQKDFFSALLTNAKCNIVKMMTKPIYVNEQMKVDEIIRTMQASKKHMAIVVDEHGGTSGLVCMEDAIEEVVGEIYDEHDDEEDSKEVFKKIGNNLYEVDGEMDLKDLYDELEIEHLPETNYSSVAGYLYELCENLPKEGLVIHTQAIDEVLDKNSNFVQKIAHLTYTITKTDGSRIERIQLEVKYDEEKEEKEEN